MAETALDIWREVFNAAQGEAQGLGHEAVDTEHLLAALARVASPDLLPTIDAIRGSLAIVNPALPGVLILAPPPLWPHVAEIGRNLLEWSAGVPCTDECAFRRLLHAELLRQIRSTEKGRGRAILVSVEGSTEPSVALTAAAPREIGVESLTRPPQQVNLVARPTTE